MKIIFLDVDGPLIPGRMYFNKSNRYSNEHNTFLYDPIAVDMIRELCVRHDAKVVYNTAHNEESFDAMRHKARVNGMGDLLHETVPRTEFCVTIEKRLDGPYDWVDRHGGDNCRWIVIDDEELDCNRQVKIAFDMGMTLSSFLHADELLGGKAKSGLIII